MALYRTLKSIVLPFLSICFFSGSTVAQDSIEVEGRVERATVFFSGAELTRKAEPRLQRGRNILVFEGLSPHIEGNSIQLRGGEELRVRSVQKRYAKRGLDDEEEKKLEAKEDSLKELEFKLSLRNSMRSVYREEKNMILENKNIKGEQQGVDVEDLMELAVYYRKRLKDIEYRTIEVENDIEELKEERSALNERIRKLEQKGKERVSEVIVALEAENAGVREIELDYFSSRAGWSPAYELNCPSLNEPVEVNYKGEVWQRTGQDWENIELTLASGRPTRSGKQPDLSPWTLQFRTPQQLARKNAQQQYRQQKTGAVPRQGSAKPQQSSIRIERELAEDRGDAAPPPHPTETDVRSSSVHTRFPIESAYDITSGSSSRSVSIKKLSVDAAHDHLAIPKLEQEAFLIAKLSGWEATDLFPGMATVQYAGRYVGKTHIDPNITDDTLQVSLGRDQGVVVKREKVKDKTSSQVIGGNKILETEIEISIKNQRDAAISLRVKDQLPLSDRGDVDIELKKDSGGEHEKESGELSWRVNLEKGESKTLRFGYSIKYPKELHPIGL